MTAQSRALQGSLAPLPQARPPHPLGVLPPFSNGVLWNPGCVAGTTPQGRTVLCWTCFPFLSPLWACGLKSPVPE